MTPFQIQNLRTLIARQGLAHVLNVIGDYCEDMVATSALKGQPGDAAQFAKVAEGLTRCGNAALGLNVERAK